jgi:preprotein translocase subunit SecD
MVFGEEKMKLTFKIWILIFFVLLSLVSLFGLFPTFLKNGVLVTSVGENSSAFEQGLRTGQIILEIDSIEITSLEDYTNLLSQKFPSPSEVKLEILTNKGEFLLFDKNIPEITVSSIPKTRLRAGLDISGGSRALVTAREREITPEELSDLVETTRNRFDEFGLSDINVVPITDLSGNRFMLIEIAGATPADLEKLISEQGVFEARIGEEVVFSGGEGDIASVSRSGQTSGIYSCGSSGEEEVCNFRFGVFLTEEAAKRHARITSKLEINDTNPEYLSEKLDLYLDGKLVDSLFIGKDLKGSETTQIAISGSGSGITRQEAIDNANSEMKQLQAILITGSLPFELEIVKLDTISPNLGRDFLRSILIAGLAALSAVGIIVFFRYRKLSSSFALISTSICEVIIILGIAAFIEWNLDLPSIAGIIAGVGTGIDSQIIVLDEAKQKEELSLKEKLKRAFRIVMGAYFTSLVALLPLLWAGAGLLKGFAITTIIGISVGVLITRPAFTDIIGMIEKE